MAIITRTLGNGTVEIRYRDVALFVPQRAIATVASLSKAYLLLALQTAAGFISDEAPVGVSGNLAQSFGGSSGNGGIEMIGGTLEDLSGRVFSSLPYAIVVDQGRRPGAAMPPVDAIMLWVERVLGIKESDDFELEEVAWAIAKAIAKRGIPATHFVEDGVTRALPTIEGILKIMNQAIAIALVTEGQG